MIIITIIDTAALKKAATLTASLRIGSGIKKNEPYIIYINYHIAGNFGDRALNLVNQSLECIGEFF